MRRTGDSVLMVAVVVVGVAAGLVGGLRGSGLLASVSSLAKVASACFSAAPSKTGANMRHGPHQAAQKSMNRVSEFSIL